MFTFIKSATQEFGLLAGETILLLGCNLPPLPLSIWWPTGVTILEGTDETLLHWDAPWDPSNDAPTSGMAGGMAGIREALTSHSGGVIVDVRSYYGTRLVGI